MFKQSEKLYLEPACFCVLVHLLQNQTLILLFSLSLSILMAYLDFP